MTPDPIALPKPGQAAWPKRTESVTASAILADIPPQESAVFTDPITFGYEAAIEGETFQVSGNVGNGPSAQPVKSEPETFDAHGKTWTRHTPGDPMPCGKDSIVTVLYDPDEEFIGSGCPAHCFNWLNTSGMTPIIGWRYADQPKPEPAPSQPWSLPPPPAGQAWHRDADPKGEAGKAKAPLWLLPPEAMRQAAWAHGLGAAKYCAWNWRGNKVQASTYISAMMRHIAAYLDGEDNDAETSAHAGQPVSHLANVIASANILIDAKAHGTLIDDRPPARASRGPEVPD